MDFLDNHPWNQFMAGSQEMTPAANGSIVGERPGIPCPTDSHSDQSQSADTGVACFGPGIFCCTVTVHEAPGETHKSTFIVGHLLQAFLRFENALADTFVVHRDVRADLFLTDLHHIVEVYYHPCPNPPPDRPVGNLDNVRQQVFAMTSARDANSVREGLMKYERVPLSRGHFSEVGGGRGDLELVH